MKYLFLIFAVFSIYGVFQPAMSRQETQQVQSQAGEEDKPEQEERSPQDKYVRPTFENLSKAYWAIGKFNFADNQAIDNFVLINECQIYTDYYHNDIEWAELREVMRNMVRDNLASYPTQFEFFIPFSLGRYDLKREVFAVEEESKIESLRHIDFKENSFRPVCNVEGEIDGYPRNMIVILSRPFSVEEIPVPRDKAEAFIDKSQKLYSNLPDRIKMRYYERQAYLRLKILLTHYRETTQSMGGGLRAVMFGKLEGIELYDDSQKNTLLYSKDLKRRKRRYKTPVASENGKK